MLLLMRPSFGSSAPSAGNTSAITAGALLISGVATSATTTENNQSAITTALLSLSTIAPGATTTDNNQSSVSVSALILSALATGATTTEKHYSALELKDLILSAIPTGAEVSFNNVTPDNNNPFIILSDLDIRATKQKGATSRGGGVIKSKRSKLFKVEK